MTIRVGERTRRLDYVSQSRGNNLNLLRIVAALCVLISHSYPLSLGASAREPLVAATGFTLGSIAVFVFFAISGFLISQSSDRRRTEMLFWWARFLRIVPGLLVAVILTALVLGPIATTLDFNTYLMSSPTAAYILRNATLVYLQPGLPGVFVNNPYPVFVNGSLWTLFYEVLCYLIIGVTGLLCKSRRSFIAFIVLYAVIYVIGRGPVESDLRLNKFVLLSFPFVFGMVAYRARDFIPLCGVGVAALAALCLAFAQVDVFREVFLLAISYCALYLGLARIPGMAWYNRLGDYSYGVYIYAFPMQQMTAYMVPGCSPLTMMGISVIPTLILAMVSWHWIEKPALAFKARPPFPMSGRGEPAAINGEEM